MEAGYLGITRAVYKYQYGWAKKQGANVAIQGTNLSCPYSYHHNNHYPILSDSHFFHQRSSFLIESD